MRSVKNLVDELQYILGLVRTPYVVFRDPLFTGDRERCFALCDELGERGLALKFECETRLDCLDDSLIDRLAEVGLDAISFGVETRSSEALRRVARREVADAHQRAIVTHCRQRGVTTTAFYMLGFPEEDRGALAQTIDYAISLGTTFAQFKLLTPYPGTPLWQQLSHRVYEHDWERFDGFTPTFQHPHLSAGELRGALERAYALFYMRPSFLTNYLGLDGNWTQAVMRRLDRITLPLHGDQHVAGPVGLER